MKPIVQVVQHLRPGGIETMALDIAKFSSNSNNMIISLEGSKEEALAAWPRLKAIKNRILFFDKKPGIDIHLINKLRVLFKTLEPATVHTHHIGPLFYAGIAARIAGVKHIIHTEHDAWHLNDTKRKKLQKLVLTLVKPLVIADSASVASSLKKHYPSLDVKTIINGIDSLKFVPGDKKRARRRLNLPLDKKVIGCSGRMETVKGHENLIKSLIQLDSHIHLALAGDGSLKNDLMNLAKRSGLEDRIHFLGRVDDMPLFYQAIDLFCLPSYQEGFPLSPLEAQSCGVTTLVTDVGGAKETLCPNSGRAVTAGNIHALTSCIEQMLVQKPTISPREFIYAYCDIRAMVKHYETLLSGATQHA